jgi:DNA polymerase III alpha subunit
MKIDKLGIPSFSVSDIVDIIYSGQIDKCPELLCEPSAELEKFNKAAEENYSKELKQYKELDIDQQQFDQICQSEWFMPKEYKELDVYSYLINKCSTSQETQRIEEEYQQFQQRDMIDLLRYMIYLVDHMRKNNIVWGVGRGSSVSSFILYLIGVHRINSIQYDLDWREFLR